MAASGMVMTARAAGLHRVGGNFGYRSLSEIGCATCSSAVSYEGAVGVS
jgi:hypothetical protein